MSFLYNGFSTEAMLNFIANHEDTVIVQLTFLGPRMGWEISIISDKYGELGFIGTIPQIMMKAFKPYLEEAKASREIVRHIFEEIHKKASDDTFVVKESVKALQLRNIGHAPKDRPPAKCKHDRANAVSNLGALNDMKSEILEMEACLGKGFTLKDWIECRKEIYKKFYSDVKCNP